MFKVPQLMYTAEFKQAAVRRVKDGQGLSAVAREPPGVKVVVASEFS
jgi:transposase